MPGGDKVTRQPWRMAYSYLYHIFGEQITQAKLPVLRGRKQEEKVLLNQMIENKINSPLTSSCGRLFDAVASLVGIRNEVDFEGQAAIALESYCLPKYKAHYPYQIFKQNGQWVIHMEDMFRQLLIDMERKEKIEKMATFFHNTIADIILSICVKIRDSSAINRIVLSGGVFQNGFLLDRVMRDLHKNHFKVFIHQKMPPNDACISLGQAVIANQSHNYPKWKFKKPAIN